MLELVMKSEVDLELLKEYLDGEFAAEEELFARYDRELEVPAELWAGIEEQIRPAAGESVGWGLRVAAVLLLTIGLASVFMFLRSLSKNETVAAVELPKETPAVIQRQAVAAQPGTIIKRQIAKPIVRDNPVRDNPVRDNPGVLSTDPGFIDIEEQDTAKHIEQTENLLRSIRNFPISDTDEE